MCLQDAEQVTEGMDNLGLSDHGENQKAWSLHSELLHTQVENGENDSSDDQINLGNSFPLESICEDAAVADKRHNPLKHFHSALWSGEWSDIGGRSYMEDTHICIPDLAKNFGYNLLGEEAISFYGVFDGHGGKGAALFVRDHLPRVIVEDADFPLELEKVVTRLFMETDAAFAKSCSFESALSSGTTGVTAMIFGRNWSLNKEKKSRSELAVRSGDRSPNRPIDCSTPRSISDVGNPPIALLQLHNSPKTKFQRGCFTDRRVIEAQSIAPPRD